MMKNRKLSKSLADASLSELHRVLDYKCKWLGINLIKADRWFPSSRRCNDCGSINKELKLADREWACNECGVVHDRDFNASMNLRDYPVLNFSTVSSTGINASGETVRPLNTNEAGFNERRIEHEITV